MLQQTNCKEMTGPIKEFCEWLGNDRKEELEFFINKSHGFEVWIKQEMAYWFGRGKEPKFNKVDIEKMVPLADDPQGKSDRKHKFVDIAFSEKNGDPLHLVELKVIWQKWNRGKMAQSAGWDLWYLERTRDEFATKSVLVFLVDADRNDTDGFLEETFGVIEAESEIDSLARSSCHLLDGKIVALHVHRAEKQGPEERPVKGESPGGKKRELSVYRNRHDKEKTVRLWIHPPGGSGGWEIVLDAAGKKALRDQLDKA